MILGTAAYMSPEQAKGRVVDKRSDVWAFGCVLYEMLTGTRAFGGEDVTDTIAAVVRAEPDWSKLPADTPSRIGLLLRRCLEKDRKARIADISVARFLIEEKIGGAEPIAGRSSRTAMTIAAIAAVVVALVGAGAWTWSSRSTTAPASLVQFEIRPPQATRLLLGTQGPPLAVSPDGSFVVYRAMRLEGEGRQSDVLMIRAWNELEARELPDTRLARAPFISPDGRWVGFFAVGELRKVPVAGGPAVDICRFRGAPGGASWGDDDHIVFSSSEVEGLQRVPAGGGDVVVLTTAARPKRDRAILPHVLPGSRFVLFTEVDTTVLGWSVQAVEVVTGAVKTVLPDAFQALYSVTGHLVYSATTPQAVMQRQGRASLRAVRFDSARAEPAGDPVTILDPIAFSTTLAGSFGLSRNGALVYVPELPAAQSQERQLVWVDRKGVETPIPAPLRNYGTIRLSPDGGKVVMDVNLENAGIWIWDLSRQTFTPVNRDQSLNSIPIWMPDGRRVIWSSTRAGGNPKLVAQAADGTGMVEQISAGGGTQFATSVSPDGRTVLMFGTAQSGTGSFDIGTVTLTGVPAEPKAIVAAPGREFGAELSPDGRWLAYHSDESGELQVYVRPYPNTDGGRWQVSNAGGSRAVWSRNGRELFYLNSAGMLMSVPIMAPPGGEFSAGLPVQILKTAYVAGRTLLGLDVRAHDVSPDGQRFLMLKEPQQASDDAQPPRMVVVLNWGEELKAKLPTP
jgi:serine/threonine-protein kinase